MNPNKKVITSLCLLIAIIATGLLLSSLGKPYNSAVFTLHKIISIVTIILTFILMRRQIKKEGGSRLGVKLTIAFAVSMLASAATGGLMSVDVGPYALIVSIHTFLPIAAAVLLVSAWLVMLKKPAPLHKN